MPYNSLYRNPNPQPPTPHDPQKQDLSLPQEIYQKNHIQKQ